MNQGDNSEPCANPQQLGGTRLGPFTALPNWLAGKVSPNQLAVIWALQLHYPNIRPSIHRIAEIAGMHRSTVLKTLIDLEERGWVKRRSRSNDQGRQLPNSYELLIWPTDEQVEQAIGVRPDPTNTSQGGGSLKTTPGVALSDGGGSLKTTLGGSPKTTQTRTREQQDQLEEIHKPPSPLTGEVQRGCVESPKPAKPAKAAADPYSRKVLPENAIPNDLLDLQELLPEWWSVKKGTRSAKVFMRVCNRVRLWTQEQRRLALESAIASGWADIYEPRTPSAASSRPRNPDGSIMTECQRAIAHMDLHQAAVADFLLAHPDADANSLPSAWQTIR